MYPGAIIQQKGRITLMMTVVRGKIVQCLSAGALIGVVSLPTAAAELPLM
jgi:hypothetical protein